MNRRQILIELAKAQLLTQDRAYIIRAGSPQHIRSALLDWKAPPEATAAADLPRCVLRVPRRRLSTSRIQKAVDAHLSLLNFDLLPVSIVSGLDAVHTRKNMDWLRLLASTNQIPWEHLPYTDYRPEVVSIICRGQEPAYAPLLDLIEQGVHPYGPDRRLTTFLVLRAY